MKFIYFYCSHFKGKNPTSRKGNYFEDMKAKLKEVLEISKEKNVDCILHGGDFTDSPVIALNLIDEIVDMIEENEKPFYAIRGSHDEIGHNPELSTSSILSHIFRRSDTIHHLNWMIDDEAVLVHGYDYYHDMENDFKKDGLMIPKELKKKYFVKKSIALTHAFIVEKPFHKDVVHILAKDLKTDYDLILLAHYHPEQGIFKIGNTTFVGIGSLARKTIGKGDTERTPNVLFVDTEKQIMDVIPLKSIRPKEETFDFEVIEILKREGESLDDFIDSLESVAVQGLGVKDAIVKICNENKIEKEIKDKIINKIDEAQEAME